MNCNIVVEGYNPQDFSFFHRSEKLVQQLINSMNGVRIIPSDKTVEEKSVDVSKVNKYRISPLIKSMETGIQVSEDISDDYKKEIGEIRTKR